jgi:hypothetical protein
MKGPRWRLPPFLLPFLSFSLALLVVSAAFSGDEEDLQKYQRQLNSEVMTGPFAVEDDAKVDAYIKEAMKKDIKPPGYAGTHWRPGYTCRNLLRYSWREYRNCRYYYRYYGRYYP